MSSMTRARSNLIDTDTALYCHCMARCVRRVYFYGKDNFTGKNYQNRHQWVADKLAELTSIFAI